MVKLGSRARDTLTGFEGIVVARTQWLYGCVRIGIESTKLDKDGKPADQELWFDEQRVELIKKTPPAVSKDSSAKTGGPRRDPRRSR